MSKELVFIGDGDVVLTNSRIVADYFGKQHKHVMRDIRDLMERGVPNFGPSSYINSQNKEQPMFTMDRDGFTLLAMGFTGKEALDFKLAYIAAFNDMEKKIKVKLPAIPNFSNPAEAARAWALEYEAKQKALEELEYKQEVIQELTTEIDLETKRQVLNRVVRHKGADYKERWQLIFRHFSATYNISLRARRVKWDSINKPKSKSYVDFIDRGLNMIPELYDVACKLFEGDIQEIIALYNSTI